MKRGFTLLELVVVIIIIGILATLGLTQFTRMVEKARAAEAKGILGSIRNAEAAYQLEYGLYSNSTASLVDAPASCATSHYFSYSITSATASAFTARADRCTASGKTPNAGTTYNITLDQTGTFGGTTGYY